MSVIHVLLLSQPPYSVVQFVVPKNRPAALSLAPTDDATVAAGASQGLNYGLSASLNVALTSTASQSSTTATFIKFPVNRFQAGQVWV